MQFFDTHTHLYLNDFEGENEAVVQRAIDSGVTRMVFPGVAPDTVQSMMDLAERFPGHIYVATGLHPTDVTNDYQAPLEKMLSYLDSTQAPVVAIGEIGIDKYWDTTYIDAQMQVFDYQVRKAVEKDLPIIIHCREGLDEVLEVLSGIPGARGVFHSFGGDEATVGRIRRTAGDFYFGINGIVTFKNSKLREVLPHIGLDRIVLETDAPWLAPVPHRGKRNESAYIPDIAAHIAQSMGVDIASVAQTTTDNANRLFSI